MIEDVDRANKTYVVPSVHLTSEPDADREERAMIDRITKEQLSRLPPLAPHRRSGGTRTESVPARIGALS
jgi:hypothetical protein